MTRRKPDTFQQAYEDVIYNLITFYTSTSYGDERKFAGLNALESIKEPEIGDLIVLQSAPKSDWDISWVEGVKKGQNEFCHNWTLRSLRTGKLANWANVSFKRFPKEEMKYHPSWRWSDAQFAFNARWLRVCKKEFDAYMVLPTYAEFDANGGVSLGVRGRHGFDKRTPSKHFPDWRKVTMENFRETYTALKEIMDTKEKAA